MFHIKLLDCIEYIIKLDFGPLLETLKLITVSSSTNKIDYRSSIFLTTPYQSIDLFNHDTNWYII